MTAGTTSRVPTHERGRSALGRLVPFAADEFARDHWSHTPVVTRAADLPGGLISGAMFATGIAAIAVRPLAMPPILTQPVLQLHEI